jgi:hypothetical protein
MLSTWTRWLAATTLATAVLVAGCGGSSANPAAVGDAATSAGSSTAAAPVNGAPSGVAFSRCMRANGVPNFPDPSPGGGLTFNAAGINPSAPAVKAAHAKCQKLLPGGGPPGPGTQTHPSAQTLAKLLNVAECMRAHGVSQFPDPRTSVPSNFGPGEYRGLTDFDGAILLWPLTLNQLAPAYVRAAAACGQLAQKLGTAHPH